MYKLISILINICVLLMSNINVNTQKKYAMGDIILVDLSIENNQHFKIEKIKKSVLVYLPI
jgi:hypothetical protein